MKYNKTGQNDPMSTPTADTLETELHRYINLIDEAVESVRGGTLPVVTALEESIGTVCAHINNLSADDAKKLEPIMAQLIGRLESLADALKTLEDNKKQNNN